MRGRFRDQGGLFSYIRPEERIPADHPLREIRKLVREVLKELSHSFGKLYSHEGRPSIPPEQLLSALLLQVFYGLRSERQLMEQLNYNLLFRRFVGLSPDAAVQGHRLAREGQPSRCPFLDDSGRDRKKSLHASVCTPCLPSPADRPPAGCFRETPVLSASGHATRTATRRCEAAVAAFAKAGDERKAEDRPGLGDFDAE